MKVTIEIPENFDRIMAFTLVGYNVEENAMRTFTHCITLRDGTNLILDREKLADGTVFYIQEKENG